MAFRIQGTSIISDSRELLGVGTAGITTALYVGENIELDAASGVATAAGLDLGTGGVTYTEVSTDLDASALATDLASAEAIVNFVNGQIGGGSLLEIIGDNDVQGEIDLANNEIFDLAGTPNQIVSNIGGVGFNTVTFSLPSEVIAPGSIESTDYVAVGAGLTVGGTLSFGGAEAVDAITETIDGSSTNLQLPTAAAVLAAIGSSVGGDIEANSLVVAGVSTFEGAVNAEDGLTVTGDTNITGDLDVTGHAELDTLRVSGLSTFQGLVALDGGADLLAGQSLGIQTNTGTLQQISFVGVNTGLVENGTAADNVLPTERAVKLYVDSQIGAANQLTFSDGTTTGEIDLATETLLFNGGTNINLEVNAAQGNELTINLDDSIVLTGDLQAGIITATGDINGQGNIVGDSATNISGINSVTALEFYGDGSNLTGISTAAQIAISDLQTDAEFPVPFASAATGVVDLHSDAGTASEALRYNPSNGTLSAVNVNSLSDSRFKENVETIENAVGKVNQLRGVEYDWSNGSGASVGVIAQEVQEVYPQLIQDGGDRLTVNYNGLVGLLLQAVKELSAEVEALKADK